MNPYTNPFIAKLIIIGLSLCACVISFYLGRFSTWIFDHTEDENEEGQD